MSPSPIRPRARLALAPRPVAWLTLAAAACAPGMGGGGPGGGADGGGGGPRGLPGGGMAMMAMEEVPRDAATIALRFRNELSLADSQVTRFSRLRRSYDSTSAPLQRALDSLVFDPRVVRDQSDEQRAKTTAMLRERARVVRLLKEQVQDVRVQVVLGLSERQREQLQVIEDAMKDDRPSGFGRPGGAGGPGGGGRPRGGGGRPPK